MKKILGLSLSFWMISMGVYFLNAGFDTYYQASGSDSVLTLDVWNKVVGNMKYSTNETDTGKKWIDGKTIYRKVINFGNFPTNADSKNTPHGIANINLAGYINIKAFATNGTRTYEMRNGQGVLSVSASDVGFYALENWSTESGYVIVEYTKN